MKSYVLGVDEAGYGPNLGPLVVAASVWEVDQPPRTVDLYARLADCVTAAAPPPGDSRLWLADSKAVYQPARGLRALERNLLSVLHALEVPAADVPTLWRSLCPDPDSRWDQPPASAAVHGPLLSLPLPLFADPDDIRASAVRFQAGQTPSGTRLRTVRARAVFPRAFNRALAAGRNKSEVLSLATLGLVAELLEELPAEQPWEALVFCDKHGGRDRYAALLQHCFPGYWPAILREGRAESVYTLGAAERSIELQFAIGSERWLPTALASMTAKYLRELAMRAWNDFWSREVPGLRPTAGYPVDAARFWADIAPAVLRLGLSRTDLWREK